MDSLKRLDSKSVSCPAGVFAYISMCREFKTNNPFCKKNSDLNNLPLVSKMTDKFTHEGIIEANWSFLKY